MNNPTGPKQVFRRDNQPNPNATGKTFTPGRKLRAVLTYADVDAAELQAFITKAASQGDLVGMCLTSDGGAYAISIKQGPTIYKGYGKDADELLDVMHQMLEQLYP